MYQEEISSSRHVELVSVAEVKVVTLLYPSHSLKRMRMRRRRAYASKKSPLTYSHVVSALRCQAR